MCDLSMREKQVLELRLTSADDKIVAMNLGISDDEVRVYKTRAKRKVAKAEKFLREMRKYKSVLYPKKNYKGI